MYKSLICILVLSFNIFAESYDRIVVLDPAVVEIIYMLEGEDKIVAISHAGMTPIVPVEETNKLESVGTVTRPSFEKIISYKPDLVIVNSMNEGIIFSLSKFGIKYIKFEINTIEEMLENIKEIGTILNKKENAEILYMNNLKKINKIKDRIKKNPLDLKGTFVYNANPLMAFSHDSVRGQILDILGVEDLAKNVSGERPILNSEYVMVENPDFLLGIMVVNSVEDIIKSNEYLKKIKVGSNIHILDSNRVMRLSPYIIEEIENIYNILREIKEKN
jgi:iron complex transport system substrate-binding protein